MPVFSALFIRFSEWRIAYLVMGLLVFVFGISVALLIIDSPEKIGLQSDGDIIKKETISITPRGTEDESKIHNHEISFKEIIQSKPFWLLYVGALCSSFGVSIPFVHMLPYSADFGLPVSTGVC